MIGVLMITQKQLLVNKGFSVNGIGVNKIDIKRPLELGLYVNNQEYCKVQSTYADSNYNLNCAFNDVSIIESIYSPHSSLQVAKTLIDSTADAIAGEGFGAFTKYALPKITYADGSPCGEMQITQDLDENGKTKSYTVLAGNILGLYFRMYNVGTGKSINATGGNYSYIYGEDNQVKAAICEEFRKITIYANDEIWFRIASLLAIRQLFEIAIEKSENSSNVYYLNKDIKQYADASFVSNIIANTPPEALPENMSILKDAKKQYNKSSVSIFAILFVVAFSVIFLIIGVKGFINNNNLVKNCSETTSGVVTRIVESEVSSDEGTSLMYAPEFEYEVNGQVYKQVSPVKTSKGLVKYKEGSQVTIYYNPSNPNEYLVDGDNPNNTFAIISVVVGSILAIVAIINIIRKFA